MRSLGDSAENPAKTTECSALIFEEASITYAASGIMGIYTVIQLPFLQPQTLYKLATRHVSSSNSLKVIFSKSVDSSCGRERSQPNDPRSYRKHSECRPQTSENHQFGMAVTHHFPEGLQPTKGLRLLGPESFTVRSNGTLVHGIVLFHVEHMVAVPSSWRVVHLHG